MVTRRETLLSTAMQLFAERGYDATSVADIQVAAGLTGGSGALYKHFASKAALLEAGVDAYLDSLASASGLTVATLPDDPVEALRALASSIVAKMTEDAGALRVLLRDLDRHPHLADRVWRGVMARVYAEVKGWIAAQRELGAVSTSDPHGVASVLVAAITQLPMLGALIGRSPGDMEPSAFIEAWVDLASRALGLETAS